MNNNAAAFDSVKDTVRKPADHLAPDMLVMKRRYLRELANQRQPAIASNQKLGTQPSHLVLVLVERRQQIGFRTPAGKPPPGSL